MTADTAKAPIECVIPAMEKKGDVVRAVWLVVRNGKLTREYVKPNFEISPIFKQ